MTADTVTAAEQAQTHKRATVRPDKAQAVAELAEAFRTASAAVLTEYRGLSVKQITELRRALGGQTSYAVVKNSLTSIAAKDAGLEGLDDLLTGPTAVAFVSGDPVEAAKGLREFAKANPVLVVKGGVMDGKALTPDEINRLADLESREVLLGKLAGAMLASLSQAVYLLNAPLAQAARLVGALEAKAQQDPSVLAGGAGTPAAGDEPAAADGASAEGGSATGESATSAETTDAPDADSSGDAATTTAAEAAGDEPTADVAADATAASSADGTDSTDSSDSSDSTDPA